MAGQALKIDIVSADPDQQRELAVALEGLGVQARLHVRPADLMRQYPDADGVALLDLGRVDAPLTAQALALLQSRRTIVTAHGANVALAVEVMRQGAVYFLEPPVRADQLALALAACALKARQDPKRLLGSLSPREREVLESIVKGETTKTVALRLGISPRTVESHRAHLRGKLGVPHLPALIGLIAGVLDEDASQGRRQA